ncbi:MAG: hypothetical protein KTR31_36210 [Myxococcales bacterium]|nr:hypothetical protein [Myxococcales bacterium]
MIAWLVAAALAADPSDAGSAVRAHTAATLAAGETVLRWPGGRTMVGLTDATTVWGIPFDLTIGGPRLGTEHSVGIGYVRASLSPSVGLKSTGRRASLRLASTVSWELGEHTLSGQLGVDGRWMRQLAVDEALQRATSFDRLQAHLLGIWDTPHTRVKLRLPLRDQGKTLTWGSGSVAWTHTTRRVHMALGVGMMVGRPFDRYTLGDYAWWFWVPYPELDLALRL